MAEYSQIPTVKLARPDTPEGYMIINASDYRAGLPQEWYDQGLAYDPAVWQPYVEPVLKAPPQADEAEAKAKADAAPPASSPGARASGRPGSQADEKK